MYKAYFDCYLDQDKSRAPHVYCLTCVKTLSVWYGAKNVHIDVPVIWLGQKGLPNDCYFCQHDFTDCTTAKKKKKKHIVYPNLQSAMRPAEHSENLPVPKPPDQEMQIVHKLEPQKMGIWLRRVDKT